jgi:hypothetical protein
MLQYEMDKVGVVRKQVRFSDTAIEICGVPVGGVVLSVNVTVLEVFSDAASTITVGSELTANKFVTKDADVLGGLSSTITHEVVSTEKKVIAAVTGTSTTGTAMVTVMYAKPSKQSVVY